MRIASPERPLEWMGSSHKDLLTMPLSVRRTFGYALALAQFGRKHECTKVLSGFGGAGVQEAIANQASSTYRAIYTVKFEEAVFVLHCFQKKSKSGVATPKEDMALVLERLKAAHARAKELRQ